MKKKWAIHVLFMILCIAMLCSIPAYAVETRASERIYYSAATLSKATNGDLSIYFSVQGTGKMDIIGASSVEVQRNTIFGWVTEHTFTIENTPAIQATGKTQHSVALTYSPLFTEKEYRALVMIYVEDATGSSTKQLISRTMTS